MLHVGIGEVQTNGLLAAINVKGPSSTTLKKGEREIGRAVEEFTNTNVTTALQVT